MPNHSGFLHHADLSGESVPYSPFLITTARAVLEYLSQSKATLKLTNRALIVVPSSFHITLLSQAFQYLIGQLPADSFQSYFIFPKIISYNDLLQTLAIQAKARSCAKLSIDDYFSMMGSASRITRVWPIFQHLAKNANSKSAFKGGGQFELFKELPQQIIKDFWEHSGSQSLNVVAEMVDLAEQLILNDASDKQVWASVNPEFYPKSAMKWSQAETELIDIVASYLVQSNQDELLAIRYALELSSNRDIHRSENSSKITPASDKLSSQQQDLIHKALTGQSLFVWLDTQPSPAWVKQLLNNIRNLPFSAYSVLYFQRDHQYLSHLAAWVNIWPEILSKDAHSKEANYADRVGLKQEVDIRQSLPKVQALHAANFEETALVTAEWIKQKVEQSRFLKTSINPIPRQVETIAIVAFDRLLARRVRALLERVDIIVQDETGWTLSTTISATAIMRLFDALLNNHLSTLLDWMATPAVLLEHQEKTQWLRLAQGLTIRNGWVRGIFNLSKALQSVYDLESAFSLSKIARLYKNRSYLAAQDIDEVFDLYGLTSYLKTDLAGREVIKSWECVKSALGEYAGLSDWRGALAFELENRRFSDGEIDTSVHMLSLPGSRLRQFNHVVLLGVDERQPIYNVQKTSFFNDAIRKELGLETASQCQQQAMLDIAFLLSNTQTVCAVWQTQEGDEVIRLGPWWRRLAESVPSLWQEQPLELSKIRVETQPQLRSQVQLTVASQNADNKKISLPARLSVSAIQRLVECPYRFFASSLLSLARPLDPSDLPERREVGIAWHSALKKFHEQWPAYTSRYLNEISKLPSNFSSAHDQLKPLAKNLLTECLDQAFKDLIARNAAFKLRQIEGISWIENYINLACNLSYPSTESIVKGALRHEFLLGEQTVEAQLNLSGMIIYGRIDRIDRVSGLKNESSQWMVIDYKLSNSSAVNQYAINPSEAVQLPLYSWMLATQADGLIKGLVQNEVSRNDALSGSITRSQNTVEAAYIGIDRSNVKIYPVKNCQQTSSALVEHLDNQFLRLMDGAPLIAHGQESVCRYCEFRGICRKGYWQ